MSSFVGLTPALCEQALRIIKPAIQGAMNDQIVNRRVGHLIVLDPIIPREPRFKNWSLKQDSPFRELVLFEYSFGLTEAWTARYDEIASAKAYASWKTGLPAQLIQQVAPYLYEEGWTKWGGSAVGEGGLVVAFSGVEAYFDQMFSEMMLAAIKAVCLHEMFKKPDGVMACEGSFLGQLTAPSN